MTRRSLLQIGMMAAAGHAVRGMAQPSSSVSIRVQAGKPLASVPRNFVGLGYEMSSVARPGLLSASNLTYVRLVRNLGAHGVVRLGGIVADYTRYLPDGLSRAEPKDTLITRADLEQLRGCLDATGWTAIWSVNFGRGTVAQAIAEAKDVARILGPRLEAIELGNEVENYARGAEPRRTPPYDYTRYRAEYTDWRREMLAAVTGLRFAAPDTAASVEWVEQMAADAHGDVQLLTTHYYRGDRRKATLEQLLEPDPELKLHLERLRRASLRSGIPWRMCETNSFFGGGHPGLSDTMAGALWTLDFMLLLAQYGCAGVNMETGVNQLGFLSSYSPIRDDGGRVEAGAPYYGMLAFAAARVAGADVLPLAMDGAGPNLTAYAVGQSSRAHALVLINRGGEQARVTLPALRMRSPLIFRLTAPAIESKTGITFGGSAVNADGRWTAQSTERMRDESIVVPAGSAAVLLAQP